MNDVDTIVRMSRAILQLQARIDELTAANASLRSRLSFAELRAKMVSEVDSEESPRRAALRAFKDVVMADAILAEHDAWLKEQESAKSTDD